MAEAIHYEALRKARILQRKREWEASVCGSAPGTGGSPTNRTPHQTQQLVPYQQASASAYARNMSRSYEQELQGRYLPAVASHINTSRSNTRPYYSHPAAGGGGAPVGGGGAGALAVYSSRAAPGGADNSARAAALYNTAYSRHHFPLPGTITTWKLIERDLHGKAKVLRNHNLVMGPMSAFEKEYKKNYYMNPNMIY